MTGALKLRILFFTVASFIGCDAPRGMGPDCDMTPEGSVWLTVVRLTWAQEKFHKLHGRYGTLVEMTNLEDGLPPDVTAGRQGSYTITMELTGDGYVLRANPDMPRIRPNLASFYGDHTGLITFDRSGVPATPRSTKMD